MVLRGEAGERLDRNIEEFKAKVSRMSDATGDAPKLALLKAHFSSGEMGSLWGRLKLARKKSDMSIAEAWSTLCAMPSGSAAAKNKVLLDLVCKPPGVWQQALLQHKDVISRTESGQVQKRKFSRGELEQLHGEREASDMINKGKWVKSLDDDGDEVFTKAVRTSTSSASRSQTMEFARTMLLIKQQEHK